MDGTQLAKALADRLAEVLPPGFSVTADGTSLWLSTPDGLGTSAWTGGVDQNAADLDLYAGVAWVILSGVQDGVTVALREPWPSLGGSVHQMALPGSRVVGDTLLCWYGMEEAPVISLAPIRLGDPPSPAEHATQAAG